jgi:quinol monooxygenase YgiN
MTEFTNAKAVYWIVELQIHPGAETAFHAAREKLVASTKEEAGALNYEWSESGDGLCHIYERYADAAAAKLHLARSGELVKKMVESVARLSFTLYGTPDEELKQMLAGRGAVVMKAVGGFGR